MKPTPIVTRIITDVRSHPAKEAPSKNEPGGIKAIQLNGHSYSPLT